MGKLIDKMKILDCPTCLNKTVYDLFSSRSFGNETKRTLVSIYKCRKCYRVQKSYENESSDNKAYTNTYSEMR